MRQAVKAGGDNIGYVLNERSGVVGVDFQSFIGQSDYGVSVRRDGPFSNERLPAAVLEK